MRIRLDMNAKVRPVTEDDLERWTASARWIVWRSIVFYVPLVGVVQEMVFTAPVLN